MDEQKRGNWACLGCGVNFFYMFTPIPGGMIQIDEHIFQMGWFNHQLVFFFLGLLTIREPPPNATVKQ